MSEAMKFTSETLIGTSVGRFFGLEDIESGVHEVKGFSVNIGYYTYYYVVDIAPSGKKDIIYENDDMWDGPSS